jgi:hypothetical protein
VVCLEQERAIIRALRKQLAADATSLDDSSEPGRDHPLAPEGLKGRDGLARPLGEIPRPDEHALGLRGAEVLECVERRAQCQQRRQLFLVTARAFRQPLEDLKPPLSRKRACSEAAPRPANARYRSVQFEVNIRESPMDARKLILLLGAMVMVTLGGTGVGDAQRGKGKGGADCQGIPCGHLPPPGQCRAWLPGVPPGQQPPPGDCRWIEQTAPPAARIIYGYTR